MITKINIFLPISAHHKTLERRNTTTGASAAASALRGDSGGGVEADKDLGDNVSNDLVLR